MSILNRTSPLSFEEVKPLRALALKNSITIEAMDSLVDRAADLVAHAVTDPTDDRLEYLGDLVMTGLLYHGGFLTTDKKEN